jgi:hemerythrin-like domain-containing protein
MLWSYATTGKRPNNMTLKQLIRAGIDFGHHLTTHHTIEEQIIFPQLGKRMPEFDAKRGDLLGQHKKIHEGLDGLEAYLERVQRGEEDLEAAALKSKMESWGGVLWAHLDDEVRALGAENMRRYWSKEEVMKMRW